MSFSIDCFFDRYLLFDGPGVWVGGARFVKSKTTFEFGLSPQGELILLQEASKRPGSTKGNCRGRRQVTVNQRTGCSVVVPDEVGAVDTS